MVDCNSGVGTGLHDSGQYAPTSNPARSSTRSLFANGESLAYRPTSPEVAASASSKTRNLSLGREWAFESPCAPLLRLLGGA